MADDASEKLYNDEVTYREVFGLADLIQAEPGKFNHIALTSTPGVTVILAGVGMGGEIPDHQAPGDAMPFLLEGKAEITVDGVKHEISAGQAIAVPEGTHLALTPIEPFKMTVTIVHHQG